MLKRAGSIVMLKELPAPGGARPNRVADPEGDLWDAYLWVEDADALHAEYAAKGVKIVRGLCSQAYSASATRSDLSLRYVAPAARFFSRRSSQTLCSRSPH